MSSKPAMMRSSRGVRRPALAVVTSTPKASSSSSSSKSAIARGSLCLGRLGLGTIPREGGHTLGHPLFPGIGGIDVRHAAALVFELQSAFRELACFLLGDLDGLAGDAGLNLAQGLLVHRLG